ncbi:hypothetical protein P43SY_004199 [Pythium insidiosum]|uniref:Mitochondrial Protein Translocase (MPT) Family n=1 Tax=Pythium insidiosum TaxID=114742 RepID=A0AAD5Q353_PYTIN|nr:hypothetical protein P43SY_004199 [Pythium insidiosum]
MASRFEILEEETHFPVKASAVAEDKSDETAEVDESLEAKLERLQLSDDDSTSVKRASEAKELGNKEFAEGRYLDAIDCYTAALKLCPVDDEYAYNRAVYYSNRAACLLKIGRTEEGVEDCSQAIELSPNYVKALLRRAEAFEKLDKLDEALKDYEAVLKIDPTIRTAVKSHERVKKAVDERNEKMKAEMMEKLKGFGNTILGKFGLSTDNFQMVQDPQTGSYNINFVQNASSAAGNK